MKTESHNQRINTNSDHSQAHGLFAIGYPGRYVKKMKLPFKTEVPIIDHCKINNLYVVIHDYMHYPKEEATRNLCAYNENGKKVWETKNLSKEPTDSFVKIINSSPLIVGNFQGCNATIDIKTGVILKTKLTK